MYVAVPQTARKVSASPLWWEVWIVGSTLSHIMIRRSKPISNHRIIPVCGTQAGVIHFLQCAVLSLQSVTLWRFTLK